MIIETSDNRFFAVRDSEDPALAHVWLGREVKRVKGAYTFKTKSALTLVRKAASRVISANACATES